MNENKKLLIIYGAIIPTMIITSILSRGFLIAWFVIASLVAIFHNQIFNQAEGART